MPKELSTDAEDAAQKYVDLILRCTQANDAELIVINRARMIMFNNKDFANEVLHSPQVEQVMTDALVLATQLHHPDCMMVLFSPARAQRILDEHTGRSKGVALLKKLLKLHNVDPTFENQRHVLETFISNPLKTQPVSKPLAVFYSEVNEALQRQTQHDKLTRAAKIQNPQQKRPNKL